MCNLYHYYYYYYYYRYYRYYRYCYRYYCYRYRYRYYSLAGYNKSTSSSISTFALNEIPWTDAQQRGGCTGRPAFIVHAPRFPLESRIIAGGINA